MCTEIYIGKIPILLYSNFEPYAKFINKDIFDSHDFLKELQVHGNGSQKNLFLLF